MNEQEWLTATDLTRMLEFLWHRVSDRKLRLFAIACSRQAERYLEDTGISGILWLAEEYADHEELRTDLDKALADARQQFGTVPAGLPTYHPVDAVRESVLRAAELSHTFDARFFAAHDDYPYPVWAASYAERALEFEDDSLQASEARKAHRLLLLRDVIGNPFRSIRFAMGCYSSNVKRLAEAIYTERAFDRLPILADALEDAGCDIADILNHFRQQTEHVRGCWALDVVGALDLVMGKQ